MLAGGSDENHRQMMRLRRLLLAKLHQYSLVRLGMVSRDCKADLHCGLQGRRLDISECDLQRLETMEGVGRLWIATGRTK